MPSIHEPSRGGTGDEAELVCPTGVQMLDGNNDLVLVNNHNVIKDMLWQLVEIFSQDDLHKLSWVLLILLSLEDVLLCSLAVCLHV